MPLAYDRASESKVGVFYTKLIMIMTMIMIIMIMMTRWECSTPSWGRGAGTTTT